MKKSRFAAAWILEILHLSLESPGKPLREELPIGERRRAHHSGKSKAFLKGELYDPIIARRAHVTDSAVGTACRREGSLMME